MTFSGFLRAILLGCATSGMMAGTSLAQQVVPAEAPPSSYSGDQYVDSQGCVFVRVGYGAGEEWVPRVGRDRRQLCGFQPTRVAGARPTGGVDPANPGPGVTVIGAAPAATPAAPAQPRTVIRRAPDVAAAPGTPAVRVITAPAAAAAPAPTQPAPTETRATCPGLTGLTAQYLSGPGVRCGPQAVHPGDAARGIDRAGPAFVNPASFDGERISSTGHVVARILPPPAPERVIPEGYEQVWEDGRINPMRGIRHISGEAQMAMVWTDTVPRRLVPAASARE